MSFFLASPNQDFRAEEILAETWGTDSWEEQLRTYITRRQKLSPFQTWCKLVTEKKAGGTAWFLKETPTKNRAEGTP